MKSKIDSCLPDILKPGLKIVFCGTAVGNRTAELKCYYAGAGNKFWPTLKKFNFIPKKFNPKIANTKLPEYEIGVTDLVKNRHGNDSILRPKNLNIQNFESKIKTFSPKILAFNGKRAAKIYLSQNRVSYGLQKQTIGNTIIFVLPSTSAMAQKWWDESQWKKLKKLTDQIK